MLTATRQRRHKSRTRKRFEAVGALAKFDAERSSTDPQKSTKKRTLELGEASKCVEVGVEGLEQTPKPKQKLHSSQKVTHTPTHGLSQDPQLKALIDAWPMLDPATRVTITEIVNGGRSPYSP